jgi:hypothetical protein
MPEIIYREQIVIDGRAYDVTTRNYTETFREWVENGVIDKDAPHHYIVDCITDDIVNS